MAKEKAFEDATGTQHDKCYWRLVQFNIGVADRNAKATFYGYKDQAARQAGKHPLPGAVKEYSVSGAEFDALMAKHLQAGGENVMKISYDYATAKKDVVPDPSKPDDKVSFFDGAIDV